MKYLQISSYIKHLYEQMQTNIYYRTRNFKRRREKAFKSCLASWLPTPLLREQCALLWLRTLSSQQALSEQPCTATGHQEALKSSLGDTEGKRAGGEDRVTASASASSPESVPAPARGWTSTSHFSFFTCLFRAPLPTAVYSNASCASLWLPSCFPTVCWGCF